MSKRQKKTYPSRETMIEELVASAVAAEMDDSPSEFIRRVIMEEYKDISAKKLRQQWGYLHEGVDDEDD